MLRIPMQANMFCLEITDHLALRRKSMSSFPRKKHVTQKSPYAIRRGITTLTQFKISALKNGGENTARSNCILGLHDLIWETRQTCGAGVDVLKAGWKLKVGI